MPATATLNRRIVARPGSPPRPPARVATREGGLPAPADRRPDPRQRRLREKARPSRQYFCDGPLAPQGAQHSLPAGGQPIASFQTLGEPQLLELAHIKLEWHLLPPQRAGEVFGAHLGAVGEETKRFSSPRTVTAGGVHTIESSLDVDQFRLAGNRVAEFHPWVRSGVSDTDSVHELTAAPGGDD